MKQEQINYQDVIDLGFEREEHSDTIFFEQYGFNWFTVELELSRRFFHHKGYADEEILLLIWNCETHLVKFVRIADREGDILGEIKIKSLDELKKAIEFYSD